jgi:hypothetical protein
MSVAAETITATRARIASSSRAEGPARGEEEEEEEGTSRATAARGGSRSQRRVDPPRARRGAQRATRADGDDAETIARPQRGHRDHLGDAEKDPDAATSPTRAARESSGEFRTSNQF